MKESQEIISNDRKPRGMVSVPPPPAKASDKEKAQQKEGEKKSKSGRLSHAAGQRK
jgi:hypothetical protein